MNRFALSGVVGWDVTPGDLRNFLREAGNGDVEIIISSPGGYVADGLEMANLLKRHPGKVTAILSGYAMSMASYIPLFADEILAEDNAVYMIHNVIGGVYGFPDEIIRYGEYTRGLSAMLAKKYIAATGRSDNEINEWLDQEKTFFGEEIVEMGFADRTIDSVTDDETAVSRQDCLAVAENAFRECNRRMAENMQAVADDLTRAAAVAGIPLQPQGAQPPSTITTEQPMDIATLKKDHPDLVAALQQEGVMLATVDTVAETNPELVAAMLAQGGKMERDRIADVRAQLIPGHEQLIAEMELDGTSTGADAAKAIVAAERDLRERAQSAIATQTNGVATPAENHSEDDQATMARAEFNQLSPAAQRAFITDQGGKVID